MIEKSPNMRDKNPWIEAARLRTLPLSISGIIVASFYAMSQSEFDWGVFVLGIGTTVGLQVLSNFANDYGDGVKGTDNENRVGPMRAIQSGAITPLQMKKAVISTALITLFLAIGLIVTAFRDSNVVYSLFFFALGLIAIASAIKYTVGNKAYGYHGLGDVFVFVFFGWVSVMGMHFLYVKTIDWILLLPASAIGMLSAGVLNLNNLRDFESDTLASKNTLVVKLGVYKAKIYHYLLLLGALLLVLVFAFLSDFQLSQYVFVLAYIPVLIHFKTVLQNQDAKLLDPELKKLALSTFLLSVLLSIGLLI